MTITDLPVIGSIILFTALAAWSGSELDAMAIERHARRRVARIRARADELQQKKGSQPYCQKCGSRHPQPTTTEKTTLPDVQRRDELR
jgi:hypothetical protein